MYLTKDLNQGMKQKFSCKFEFKDLSKLKFAIRKLSEDDVALFMIELTCKKLNGFNFHFCSVFKKRTRQNSSFTLIVNVPRLSYCFSIIGSHYVSLNLSS